MSSLNTSGEILPISGSFIFLSEKNSVTIQLLIIPMDNILYSQNIFVFTRVN